MASLARELTAGGVRLLQIASTVYLFREHVAEPTLVRRGAQTRSGEEERGGGDAVSPSVSLNLTPRLTFFFFRPSVSTSSASARPCCPP